MWLIKQVLILRFQLAFQGSDAKYSKLLLDRAKQVIELLIIPFPYWLSINKFKYPQVFSQLFS